MIKSARTSEGKEIEIMNLKHMPVSDIWDLHEERLGIVKSIRARWKTHEV